MSANQSSECPASGQGCSNGPFGPRGKTQCEYCGSEPMATTSTPAGDAVQGIAGGKWTASLFKGADGLQKLADADAFWLVQPYGTRLYFGDGIADYLHRDVLRAALKGLTGSPGPSQVHSRVEGKRLDEELPRRLFVVEEGSNGAAPSGCELVLDDVEGGNEERDYFLVSVVNGDPDVLKQMAHRLTACWDICQGSSTEELLLFAGRGDAATLMASHVNASRYHLEARVTALEDLCHLAVGAVSDIDAGFPMKELAVSVAQLKQRAAELGVDLAD